jgi:phage virion morphogenesis protein
MVAEVRVKIESRAVSEAFADLVRRLPAGGNMAPAMQSMARALKTGAQMRFRTEKTPEGQAWEKSYRARTEGGQTLSLTRRLRNSITAAHGPTTASVGTNVAYAAIHQFGGVIRAKKGPFLAIPVTPAARQAGSPRNMPGLHVWQTVKGQFVMGTENGTVHYLLKRQVTIPARPYLGASDADKTELLRVVQDHLATAWKRS